MEQTFIDLVNTAYLHSEAQRDFTLDEVLTVFDYYFTRYRARTGHDHPHLKKAQIKRIIESMPFVEGEYVSFCVGPEDYIAAIDKHFLTEYRKCDWNINHFFSGSIRMYRFLEIGY